MVRNLSNHFTNENSTTFDINAFSTPPAPPPYHSISTPLPRQQSRIYPTSMQSTDRQYSSNNTSRLKSVKEFVSNRIKNISSEISSSIERSTSSHVTEQHQHPTNSIDSNMLSSFDNRFHSNEQQFNNESPSMVNNHRVMNTNVNNSNNPAKSHEGLLYPAVNDSLERIGHSLQNLIDEAEASLLGPQNYAKNKLYLPQSRSRRASPTPSIRSNDSSKETFADYSYRYVQQGYVHSQEKLTVAIEQLEHSIQTMLHFNSSGQEKPNDDSVVTHLHHHHHHYVEQEEDKNAKKVIKKKPSKGNAIRAPSKKVPADDDENWHITLATTLVMAVVGYISVRRSRQNRYGNMCLIILLLLSLYRKKNIKRRFPVMNLGDRFVVRLVFLKGTTPLLGFIHRFNILYHCATRFLSK